MLFRFTSLAVAGGLLLAMWAMIATRRTDARAWVRPQGGPRGPVKILNFYASVGQLQAGEKALLCYGVENAKSVKISPAVANIYPSVNHCVGIEPSETTHYMILAEGFDGQVAIESFTLHVERQPLPPARNVRFARS